MQINSTSNISDQYLSALQTKQKETSTGKFEEELTKESTTEKVDTSSSVKSVEEQQPERYHEVLTYANTKGMTYEEVDEYFSERSEEEKSQIKFMIGVSNNFSEDDVANEAVFMEAKSKVSMQSRHEFSIQMAKETMDYSLGSPTLSNVLEVSPEYYAAIQAGVDNPRAQGIFMNAADKARYESGVQGSSYNDTLLSSEEAGDFLSTMLEISKQKMEQARGTAVFDDYKEAYERYSRMNDNYNSLLAKKEETNQVNIQV